MARFGLVVLAVIMLFQPKGVLAVANITLLLMSLVWVVSVGIGARCSEARSSLYRSWLPIASAAGSIGSRKSSAWLDNIMMVIGSAFSGDVTGVTVLSVLDARIEHRETRLQVSPA